MSTLFDDDGNVPWAGRVVNADRGAVACEVDEDTRSGCRSRILAMFASRPGEWINSHELVPVTHRFSASIHELRNRGHHIEGRRTDDGTFEWLYSGFEPRVAVAAAEKQSYYLTAHWRAKRIERLDMDSYRCVQCHATDELEVHHWRYDLFAEQVQDLTTLCAVCHRKVHDALAIHFPKHVSWAVKQRLVEATNATEG